MTQWKRIKTVKTKGFSDLMLQGPNGNTLSCIHRHKDWYESDSFSNTYNTVREAKEHMVRLIEGGYFGECILSWWKEGKA